MQLPSQFRLGRRTMRKAMRMMSGSLAASWPPVPSFDAKAAEGLQRKVQNAFANALKPGAQPPTQAKARPAAPGAAEEIADFGPNPGALRMLVHAPARLSPGRPLVVVLHGCSQRAAAFARDTGWIAFSDRTGIPLLLPEQRPENNGGTCFDWFQPADTGRDLGEAASIRRMVAHAVAKFGCDPDEVYVVGLSAGGAMAAALLAAYPDVFAGGAVVAGLPAGSAATTAQALGRMSSAGAAPKEGWTARARAACPGYDGPWPVLSVWHGGADHTVDPHNADSVAAQFAGLHAATPSPASGNRQVWRAGGREVVEHWRIPGMGHGFPIDRTKGGNPAPFVLETGIDAAGEIARFWAIA